MRDTAISFIVPIYNVKEYLTACVESIMRYPAKDAEIILLDDGSPDGSGEICDQLALRDARIRVIHQANAGVSAARNAGLDCAHGKWISFIDGDDYIFPEALMKAEKLLESDDDIIFFSWHNCYDEKTGQRDERCSGRVVPFDEKDIETIRLNTMYRADIDKMAALGFKYTYSRSIWSCLWRADVINANHVRFVPGVKLAQDVLFRLTCLQHCRKGAYVDEDYYGYRMAQDSVTHKMMPKVIDVLNVLFPQIRRIIKDIYHDDKRMLGRMYAGLIMESRRLIDLYLNHPDCTLPINERAKILDAFLKTPLMAESVAECDGSQLVDPIDKLYDAYRIADPERRYLAAVQAVKQQSSHTFLKKALGSLGLLDWAKYTYRNLKRKLRGLTKGGKQS